MEINNISMRQLCRDCGNKHFGPCATEETVFLYRPLANNHPSVVSIVGSWSKWQHSQTLFKKQLVSGECVFQLSLPLLKGNYHYKYIVDGVWTHDPFAQLEWDPNHRTLNNSLRVYPKKMYLPIDSEGMIRISVGIVADDLTIIGSWDNWAKEIPMHRKYNQLQGREQNVAYVPVQPGQQYQFLFKLNRQYLIDENYPNILNPFHTYNNTIIAAQSQPQPQITPPTTQQKYHQTVFRWQAININCDLLYQEVQGHSMCSIGQSIFIFGGKCRCEFYNTLTRLNIRELGNPMTEEVLPNGRAFPAMVTYGNKIIVFGGHNNTILHDYFSFEVSESKWMANPTLKGKCPEMREKASCVLYQMFMVFFGGYYCSYYNQYEHYYQDIFVLDIQNMKWVDSIAILGCPPPARYAHAAALIKEDMFIFGGTSNALDNINLNDLWKINLYKVNELQWNELRPKGKLPNARHGHTMNTIGKYLVVFGGKGVTDCLGDVVLYDTTENEWSYPVVQGTPPKPRFYHASTVHQGSLIIFGGKNSKGNQHLYLLKSTQLIVQEEEEE